MEVKLFHTNDIHSYLSNYHKIARYINDRRTEHPHMLYMDLGDHVDRSHPLTEATLGKANVKLLNDAQVDVVTIGNNEGITLDHESFNQLYSDATFPVTCCNLFDVSGNLPDNIRSSVILEKHGIKYGIVGATAEFTPFYKALGWDVTDPMSAIIREIHTLHEHVDVVIVLSHLGKFFDRQLAEACPEIDIILGAHTHHYFLQGEVVNGVLIGAAGRYGEYIGEMTLTFEGTTLICKSARLIDTNDLRNTDEDYYEMGANLLKTKISTEQLMLPRRLYSASYTTHLLLEALMKFTEGDCALINSGLIVQGYEGNNFTYYDLHTMLPHPINPVKITLTGRELKEIINMSMHHDHRDEIVKGFGFRGDLFGMYVWRNIGFIQSQQRYFIGTEEINNHRKYKLATLDMYTFGRFFPQFTQNEKRYYMPEFLRDIMETAIKNL
ncbi:bifunctional metallophosphatase/5'-nucleotidase [Macrococcus armenti]|uniref:bifunctional metallophosphatase/5'-nucleotidase n=1 Tax=Macrococcus armenti TaxID=2875764 RepID=UPI001CCC9FAC|nr:bifunctional UDP-sugar hydrolase/5'-nucleotidase [Macrococcus armenti]UBH15995.1 bifunctional metallophosphatase/5'-nucleotidase [Macrococcus armenti]UBH18356.1 bifunctional metallophosphatase/5'-nucleotidase [Macrococcus armenti]UBH20622.1 bifunctional metallophosphatase/5'-nucleotidase [Macrococcus armenti]